jgi:hypothetical protein
LNSKSGEISQTILKNNLKMKFIRLRLPLIQALKKMTKSEKFDVYRE